MWHRLFSAYFREARPIFFVADLVSLAGEIEPDPEDARAALLSHPPPGWRTRDGKRPG